MIEHII